MTKILLKVSFRIIYIPIIVLGFQLSICSQTENDNFKKEMEAFKLASSLSRNINSSRDYITNLNELLSHPEYFKYTNYSDIIAWWYNNTGRYKKGIEIGDQLFPDKTRFYNFSPENYKIKNAVEFIIEKSTSNQVIMINEEHRMSRHRALPGQLLQALYNNGFRYLAVETLMDDSTLELTGQPVLNSGAYSKDPIFAEFLRTAAKIGYTMIPYDVGDPPDDYGQMNEIQRIVWREKTQAENIINRILDKDSKAKILVYGGRGHIAEYYEVKDSLEIGFMAGFFKHLSGIDPLTIDQLENEEHFDSTLESLAFSWVRKSKNIKQNFFNVLVDKKTDSIFTRQYYDISIVPSLDNYYEGRPDWLINMPGRKKLYINVEQFQPADSSYFLVQAIYESEDSVRAIPADQFAYQQGQNNVLLLLKPNIYNIRILNNKGYVLKEWREELN
ncbi:MAG TPA: hypothetical protein VKA26_11330 [Ignavibacteriaceae bacterium]|nr:hypothetical protein [Ignavibacteriaceae bacterium]HKJ81520.1 hypothetical protein [Ignavibacteriaceae bacterium]